MPLAFQSLSHGQVAFGFFNIETDMLLLDIHFFFADDFCVAVRRLAEGPGDMPPTVRPMSRRLQGPGDVPSTVRLEAYTLEPSRIGNLMGSIRGTDLGGFIGEVYRLYPFPAEEEKFRQQPEGFRNRKVIEKIMAKYAKRGPVGITFDPADGFVDLGGYVFARDEFLRLILYVWAGGYPRWRDGTRPGYVMDMRRAIESSSNTLFSGLEFGTE